MTDPLTQLLPLLRPRSFLWKQLVGRGAWEWRFPAVRGVVFGWVVAGQCRFEVPGADEEHAGPGDYLLMTDPGPWSLPGGEGSATPVEFETAYAAMQTEHPPSSESSRPGGSAISADVTRVLAGHFEFNPLNSELLASLLPPVVHLPAAQRSEHELLSRVLAMIEAEGSSEGPGRDAVMSRLLEIMLLELLRTPHLASQRRGMLRGLTDPPIAAVLRAVHDDIAATWSVSSMAARAHLSRSAFSQRFAAVVGEPPMTYVANWRMTIARENLLSGQTSVEQVAAATGYGSVSAFSTAFSRTVGVSPARYIRSAIRT